VQHRPRGGQRLLHAGPSALGTGIRRAGYQAALAGPCPFATLRDAYQQQVAGLLDGGVDAVLIETAQDLLQAKAAILGARRALAQAGADIPVIAQVTVETTGTMLLGTEIGAALTALAPLGIEMIGLNCATGPAEMSEHLRTLSRTSAIGLSAMPNAGLPVLTADGAHYPLLPDELADAHDTFTREYGLALVGGCCGSTPSTWPPWSKRVQGRRRFPAARSAVMRQQRPCTRPCPSARTSPTCRSGSAPTRTDRRPSASPCWQAPGRTASRSRAPRIRDGSHVLDLCVDYVGRDGVADMREMAGRLATASTLPIMIDSTEPGVIEAGLEMLGGRAIVNSVNYEDGDGPHSRFARIMPLVREHGAAVVALTIDEEGQARTAEWKVRVADRLIRDLSENWGMSVDDILVDCLTFPIATGQEETRRDAVETIEAIRTLKAMHPTVQTTLGLSNVSFGLNPAARQVLNSVFLHEAVEAGLELRHRACVEDPADEPDPG
jgi:5-methyltetrahydrofolate--homocysteine methyltransferase